MGTQESPKVGAHYTRGELELELGKLAVRLGRLRASHGGRARRGVAWLQPAVHEFLDACVRLMSRTRSAHRGMLMQRLCHLAASAELELVGLPEWLEEQKSPYATTEFRVPANASGQARDGASMATRRR